MEKKIKHLEMIETIIERMGNNSFQLKGWAVALVALVGALSAQGADKRFFVIVFVPLFAFWFLDSFYLQLERKYKILYKNVVKKAEQDIDFNMDIHEITCDDEEKKRVSYWRCLFSLTEWTFYLTIVGAVTALVIVLKLM